MLIKLREQKYPLEAAEPRKQMVGSKTTLFVEPGRVAVAYASHVTGINRTSQKRWYRWESTGGCSYYLTKTGKIAGKRKIGKSFVSVIDFGVARNPEISPLIQENVGDVDFDKIFPSADHWAISTQDMIPYGLTPAMREPDLPSFVRAAFGKTRYRRDLVKGVGYAPAGAVAMARDFRGLVPTDWIINFLRINAMGTDTDAHRREIIGKVSVRPFLFTIDPRSYKDLLQTEMSYTDWRIVEDMGRMAIQAKRLGIDPLPANRYRTWRDIHDAMEVRLYDNQRPFGATKAARQYRKDIPQTALAEKLDGLKLGGYRFVTPKNTDELVEWGQHMRNCIGSYGYQVAVDNSSTTLGAVYQGKDLIANFEIGDGSLKQLLGRFNRGLGKEVCAKLEPAFKNNGVVVAEYWGAEELTGIPF